MATRNYSAWLACLALAWLELVVYPTELRQSSNTDTVQVNLPSFTLGRIIL
jgi:hypothetical protein